MSRKKETIKRIGGPNSTTVLEKHTETFEYFMRLSLGEYIYFDEDTKKHIMSIGKHKAGLVYIIYNPKDIDKGKPERSQCGYHSFTEPENFKLGEEHILKEIKQRILFGDYTTLAPSIVRVSEIEIDYE